MVRNPSGRKNRGFEWATHLNFTDEGWNLRATRDSQEEPLGMHGYDPRLPSMQGTFIGHGPGLAAGKGTSAIEIVDIYELMCHLLGLDPAPNDGSLEAVGELLATPPVGTTLRGRPSFLP